MKFLRQLLPAEVLATLPTAWRDLAIDQLAFDSRQVGSGALFAAWQGRGQDGHAFLPEAQRRGAVCALVQRVQTNLPLPQILCPDPRRLLAHAARSFYDAPDAHMALVGITGTNGKTTCAHLLASVLAAWRQQAAALGTLGAFRYRAGEAPRAEGSKQVAGLTTAEAPALVQQLAGLLATGCTAAALEASSIALDQGRLDAVELDVAAWSNLSQDHLDYHGSLASYRRAKERLFTERLKPAGTAVFNADDPGQNEVQARLPAGRTLRFSLLGARGGAGLPAHIYCRARTPHRQGQTLEVHTPRGPLWLHSALVGDFNAENLLLVVAVAEALGVPHAAVQAGVAALAGVPGRLEQVLPPAGAAPNAGHEKRRPLVLVDYAHTPDALARVLAATRPLTPGRLWCVFGCGGDRDPGKRALMGEAVARLADLAVVSTDNPRSESPAAIAAAVVTGLQAAGAVQRAHVAALAALPAATGPTFCVQLDRAAAIGEVIGHACGDDTVVLAGKGHETVQIVGKHPHPFDDRAYARCALAKWPEV